MNKLFKVIFGALTFLLFFCVFFLCSNGVTSVYAAEGPTETTTTETEINYIKSIDTSSLPGTISEKEDKTLLIQIKYVNDYDETKKNEKLSWYIDATGSNGKAYVNVVSYDANGNAVVSIAGVEEGSCCLVFYGSYHERTDLTGPRITFIMTVNAYESIGSIISSILKSSTVLILIISISTTVIGKFAIKIFRFGVNYKSNFASVEDNERFKESVRKELATNKEQTREDVLKMCLREISRETRPVRDLTEMYNDVQKDREILEIRLNHIDEQYNEIKKVSENISNLENKVTRLQYGEGTSEVRRSGK